MADGPKAGELESRVGRSRDDRIWVGGQDLVDDIMGQHSFTDTLFLMLRGRWAAPGELRLLDACLTALADHGLTGSAVAARLTYSGAPEALQAAVAAGLLGLGSRIAGSMEGAGEGLAAIADAVDRGTAEAAAVTQWVQARRAAGLPVPGFGHRQHRGGDPRAQRLLALAEETGLAGRYVRLAREIEAALAQATGRRLPLNVTGAIAAVLMDLGFPWQILRGFALISRTAGLVAHLAEEMERPLVPEIRRRLEASPPAAQSP